LYQRAGTTVPNSLSVLCERCEHGFETRIHARIDRPLPEASIASFAPEPMPNDRLIEVDGQFKCSCCGEMLNAPPLAWHFDAPDSWNQLSPFARKQRGELSSDQCVIDDEHFFVRGLVEIPVLDGDGPFAWGVWVSLSRTNFERANALWHDSNRVSEASYFGWLCNSIPAYPETLNLKTAVHTREVGLRPLIELEATDHPLAIEQRDGITAARIRNIAEKMHHHNASLPVPRKKRFGLF